MVGFVAVFKIFEVLKIPTGRPTSIEVAYLATGNSILIAVIAITNPTEKLWWACLSIEITIAWRYRVFEYRSCRLRLRIVWLLYYLRHHSPTVTVHWRVKDQCCIEAVIGCQRRRVDPEHEISAIHCITPPLTIRVLWVPALYQRHRVFKSA